MFNLLLALLIGILIGWSFHSFFMELNAPNILKDEFNISSTKHQEQLTKPIQAKSEEQRGSSLKEEERSTEVSRDDSFDMLLRKGLFSDAMALYLDAQPQQLSFYRSVVFDYFRIKSRKNPNEAIIQMSEFIELEPEHNSVALLLIETYKSQKEYAKAITLIVELIESASASELDALHLNLIRTSESYIDMLKTSKNYQTLVSFLEEQIQLGIESSFYIYALAEYYVSIRQYPLAEDLLKEIEFDENYGEKVKLLLNFIEQNLTENRDYSYQIPLKKVGDHFTIDIIIEGTPLTLLLDTGATLTTIDESKLPLLKIINENINLDTAGGIITAQLQEATTFSIGEIKLKDFQVISTFLQLDNADGLLGMNFFKKFKFKIDQDEAVLYLSEITTVAK